MDAEDPTTLAMLIKAIELKGLTRAAPAVCGRADATCEVPARPGCSGCCAAARAAWLSLVPGYRAMPRRGPSLPMTMKAAQ